MFLNNKSLLKMGYTHCHNTKNNPKGKGKVFQNFKKCLKKERRRKYKLDRSHRALWAFSDLKI